MVTAVANVSVARPAHQNSTSHSRLVTTKLTATPQASTTGPGWSRPSSATPPVAPSPSSTPNASSSSQAPQPTAPQLPHAGKVIQPQPRAVASGSQSGASRGDGSGGSNKTVWGNVKTSASKWNTKVQDEFPTAAEVAQGMYSCIIAMVFYIHRCCTTHSQFISSQGENQRHEGSSRNCCCT
jgi:serine/arginine repetitive matrix protein 2